MNEPLEMKTQEFADCLDRRGSNLARWPLPQQAAGNNLLAASERARELLAEAHALDRWLASATDHQAPMGLARTIVNRIPQQDLWQHVLDWFSAALWRPALAATCMLLAGFAIGIAAPNDDDLMLDDVSMLAFSATYEEFEDTSGPREPPDARQEPQDARQEPQDAQ